MSPDVDKRVVGRKKLCIPLTRASLVSQNKALYHHHHHHHHLICLKNINMQQEFNSADGTAGYERVHLHLP